MNTQKNMFLIKFPYWLGIVADALWAVALFSPVVFGMLTGQNNFNPDLQIRLIMGIGGILMTGWTLLLLWAVGQPVERRAVIPITAFLVDSPFMVIFSFIYIPVWSYLRIAEERDLVIRYGTDYEEYCKNTGFWLPKKSRDSEA